MTIESILAKHPIVPVVTIADVDTAVPLATALAEGGIDILEVTLRSAGALDAIGEIAHSLPHVTVGAGTVKSGRDLEAVVNAGAKFAVSPGTTPTLLEAAAARQLPFLPAASTATEVMVLLDAGFNVVKFFPAEAMGGTAALAALAGPLPDALFCPSGGISAANYCRYLSLDNVVSVSGSWLTPSSAVRGKRWREITDRARTSLAKLT